MPHVDILADELVQTHKEVRVPEDGSDALKQHFKNIRVLGSLLAMWTGGMGLRNRRVLARVHFRGFGPQNLDFGAFGADFPRIR